MPVAMQPRFTNPSMALVASAIKRWLAALVTVERSLAVRLPIFGQAIVQKW